MSSTRFRAGVGILVVGADDLVLGFERVDHGSWQAPQGGIDKGEGIVEAARRELGEETGLRWPGDVEQLAEYPAWLGYDIPTGAGAWSGQGQVQKWFLVRLTGSAAAIDLDPGEAHAEFGQWRWMTMAELIDETWPPRRPIYRLLAAEWSAHLAGA